MLEGMGIGVTFQSMDHRDPEARLLDWLIIPLFQERPTQCKVAQPVGVPGASKERQRGQIRLLGTTRSEP